MPTSTIRSACAQALRIAGLAVIIAGLSVALFDLAGKTSRQGVHSHATFLRLQTESVAVIPSLQKAWAPRVASLILSHQLVRALEKPPGAVEGDEQTARAVAYWTAGWFVAIALLFVIAFRSESLFFIWGTFAGVIFGYLLDPKVYSWDMTSLFVFSLVAVLLAKKSSPDGITVLATGIIIAAGVLFKETSAVLAIFPLFLCRNSRWLHRILMTMAIGTSALAVKVAINYLQTGSVFTLATDSFYDDRTLLAWNMQIFSEEPILLANAGMILALLLLPSMKADLLFYKAVTILFIVGNFLFGVVNEYRIWFELIPLALLALHRDIQTRLITAGTDEWRSTDLREPAGSG